MLGSPDSLLSLSDENNAEALLEETSLPKPNASSFTGFHSVIWYVGNAKQTASYWCDKFGFREIAYQGLENGSKDVCTHVVQKGSITMVFMCALRSQASDPKLETLVDRIHRSVRLHGDAVKDVAFSVDDVDQVYNAAVTGGAVGIQIPEDHTDQGGTVRIATIKAIGDVTHTFVDKSKFNASTYRPGFIPPVHQLVSDDSSREDTGVYQIDHCVANLEWDKMEESCKFYERALGFHKFWSVDDKQIRTEFSALRSTVMASGDELIKMPVNEPAVGKKRSQVEEFNIFNGGPGIQHIALLTHNIIETVQAMRKRGVEFITVPSTYYDILKERLSNSKVHIVEDLNTLQSLDILIDFDDHGYLLQLFSKPLADRPTVFIEIIQRENFDGFGAGNFKSLFESIEQEQRLRGTLD